MQEIKQLLNKYLQGGISSEDFVIKYLALARILRDETLAALSKSPEIDEQLDWLLEKRFKEAISKSEYEEKWTYLTNQLVPVRVKPYSNEEKILSHLFVEADAYRENPEERESKLHIGDTELKAEVQKALEMLNLL